MLCTECIDGELVDYGDYLECETCEAQFEAGAEVEEELELIEDPAEDY